MEKQNITPDMPVGMVGPIGKEEVHEAENILQKYKQGKAMLEQRIIENEQWFKLRHWDVIRRSKNPGDPEPASAWLLNSIMNKHADAMDNYPAPHVLPRERSDEEDAQILSAILPVILEQCNYEQTYSDMWWYKLKSGTGVIGVYWDQSKNNGLGEIDIRGIDLLNLFWEPGITDIQKSRNLFHVALMDRDVLLDKYPMLEDALASPTIDVTTYIYDESIDTSDKCAVVDWYYKKNVNGKDVLHYCKFCNGQVLYASENDRQRPTELRPVGIDELGRPIMDEVEVDASVSERGFYDHGRYPFVFDVLFPDAGMPAGFGYIDVCKSPQLYIDKLDQVILKHSVMGSRPRFFIRGDGAVNEEEFAQWEKDFVHFSGSGNPNEALFPIQIPELSGSYINIRSLKVDELKETSGNRDFTQGSTVSGVTAASAIAALQEAGSKLSRDMIKASYRAFAQINYLCIELIRQFYTEDRWFRIVGDDGEKEYVQFSGRRIAPQPQGNDFGVDMGYRVPHYDITVISEKASPFSTTAQNERAKELYGMGFFRPDLADQALAALDMMTFEGIEKVRSRIAENGTMYQQIQQMQAQMQQMAAIIDAMRGTQLTAQMASEMGQGVGQPNSGSEEVTSNPLGDVYDKNKNAHMTNARLEAAEAATPR